MSKSARSEVYVVQVQLCQQAEELSACFMSSPPCGITYQAFFSSMIFVEMEYKS